MAKVTLNHCGYHVHEDPSCHLSTLTKPNSPHETTQTKQDLISHMIFTLPWKYLVANKESDSERAANKPRWWQDIEPRWGWWIHFDYCSDAAAASRGSSWPCHHRAPSDRPHRPHGKPLHSRTTLYTVSMRSNYLFCSASVNSDFNTRSCFQLKVWQIFTWRRARATASTRRARVKK